MIKSILVSSIVALSTIVGGVSDAKAAGCYTSLAANSINEAAAGGLTLQESWDYAVSKGHVVNTNTCFRVVRGYVRTVHLVVPYAYNLLW